MKKFAKRWMDESVFRQHSVRGQPETNNPSFVNWWKSNLFTGIFSTTRSTFRRKQHLRFSRAITPHKKISDNSEKSGYKGHGSTTGQFLTIQLVKHAKTYFECKIQKAEARSRVYQARRQSLWIQVPGTTDIIASKRRGLSACLLSHRPNCLSV